MFECVNGVLLLFGRRLVIDLCSSGSAACGEPYKLADIGLWEDPAAKESDVCGELNGASDTVLFVF